MDFGLCDLGGSHLPSLILIWFQDRRHSWLPCGAGDWDRGVSACGAPPGKGREWGGVRGRGQWQLKVSGTDNGHRVRGYRGAGGAGWGGVDGTVAPQQECDRLSGNVNVSPHCSLLPRGGLPPWLHAHPATHGLEPPMGMAWRGARRWVIPESPPPASLSNLLGLGRMMGQGHRASLCHRFAGDLRQVPVSLQASVSPSV